MNQIPNIEKTMRRGIKLIAGRIEALHPQYFLDETTYKHDVKGTMDVVKGVMADIEETHHQQLQKAREKTIRDMERRMMGWSGTATAMLKDYRKIIYRDHSELDQDVSK